ncbi:autophagy-related protein 22-like protein [Talaromyces proteolyticus]|uniref:Autophagy-related protein n=1 Tax=Talaromyces proteolyticus TaxID=1131652 RepID=A0AAD4KF20_9EURO|nr:autophagy-related protein 22-like protein [Talaromyces proteolyticus]KAH8690495.1 autophagy-related protein 22-like protein [Talaromyces proteolyticus]
MDGLQKNKTVDTKKFAVSAEQTTSSEENGSHEVGDSQSPSPMETKKALYAYLILCFSTGPTSSMAFNYVSAAIQSAANYVGHQPGSNKPCARRGSNISCVVKFGRNEIDYQSFMLYLKAIARAMEGVVTISTAGIADYSHYRKSMMMGSIFLFGALALPFAGMTKVDYSHLNALASLYCIMTAVQGVYTVIEGSYIPIFMRSAGLSHSRPRLEVGDLENVEEQNQRTWKKGFSVSVYGLVASNIGGLIALIIGVILVFGRGSYVEIGYFNYLLAITIAGCITIFFAFIGQYLLPSVPGREIPMGQSVFFLPIKGWFKLLSSITRYPEAFKLCIGWILWNTGYSNFLGLISSLFLQVTGFSSSDGAYQVWSFTSVIFAVMGSLGFLYLFPRVKIHIKSWVYVFLIINILCVLWGCIGISNHVTIGYKHQAEFWVEQVLFMSTSSALRSYNRAVYSSLLPKGSEAQFFGLEITLDLATGWINPLVQGVIQDNTHNLRFPMIPNLLLMLVATALYVWVDIPKGMEDAKSALE